MDEIKNNAVPLTNPTMNPEEQKLILRERESSIDREICKDITDFETKFGESLQPYKEKTNIYLNLYHSKSDHKYHKKAKSNIFVPETFRAIETLASHIYQIIFSEEPFFIVEGREAQDIKQGKIIEGLVDYQMKQAQFKRRMLPGLRSLITFGVIVVQYSWKYEERRITKKQLITHPLTGEQQTQLVEQTDVTKDYPDFEVINILDLIVNPYISNIDEQPVIIVKKKFTFEQLKQWEKEGYISNVDQLQKIDTGKGTDTKTDKLKEQRMKDAGFVVTDINAGDYTVSDRWGNTKRKWIDINLDGTPEGEEIVQGHIIKCQDVILKRTEIPYWDNRKPFISCGLFELLDEMFPMGLGQILETPQYAVNDNMNQINDHKTFSIYHMFLKGKKSGAKRKDFGAEPDKVIDCEDVSQIKEIIPNPQAMSEGIVLDKILREDMRNAAMAPTTVQGIQTPGQTTLGEVQMMNAEGSSSVRTLAISISEQLVKPLLEAFYRLTEQYMTTKKIIKVMGKMGTEYIPVTENDVVGDWDFIPKVMTDVQNKITVRQNMIEMLGMVIKAVPAMPPLLIPSMYKLMKKIYEMHDFKDGEEQFPSLPETGGINDIGQNGTETANSPAAVVSPSISEIGMGGVGGGSTTT